jgi:hypothetical protein
LRHATFFLVKNSASSVFEGYGQTMLAALLVERGFADVADTTESFGRMFFRSAQKLIGKMPTSGLSNG